MIKMLSNLKWSSEQDEDEEDIALANFIENYKASWWGKFSKKITRLYLMIMVLYPIKKN